MTPVGRMLRSFDEVLLTFHRGSYIMKRNNWLFAVSNSLNLYLKDPYDFVTEKNMSQLSKIQTG